MKIRTSYVSNSSSTSFCVVGVEYKEKDFDRNSGKLKEILLENLDKEEGYDIDVEKDDVWELLFKFSRHMEDIYPNNNEYKDFSAKEGLDNYNAVVGIDIHCMNGDETLNQFKERVFNMLKTLGYIGGKESIKICVDGGYEG